jgi:hypothetical protein
VPREARLRNQVASLRVSGAQAVVREVAVTAADGDRSVMTIEPTRATSSGAQSDAGRMPARPAARRPDGRRAMQPTPPADAGSPPRLSRRALWIWLAFVVVAALIAVRTRYVADLSAFLPSAPTAEQGCSSINSAAASRPACC